MKHILLFFTVFLVFSCGSNKKANQTNNNAQTQTSKPITNRKYNALQPKGTVGKKVILAQNKRAVYQIVIPRNPTPQEKTAGQELQKWLLKITGATFALVSDGSTKNERFISLGNTRLLDKYRIKRTSYDLGDEGYAIVQKGEAIFIIGGKKRGPINGVFAFLEEDLGCRWYTADKNGFVIPAIKSLAIQPTTRTEKPAFDIRTIWQRDAASKTFNIHNRLNPKTDKFIIDSNFGEYPSVPKGWQGHTFYSIIPAKTYFATHPQYFAYTVKKGKGARIKNGQRCLTNPDVLKITKEKIFAQLKANPKTNFISISQVDGKNLTCMCGKCAAVHESEGAKSGTLIRFVNEVAKAVEKRYPKVKITTLAYRETAKPPKTKPRSNVIVELCTDSHWGQYFTSIDRSPTFMGYLRGWKRLTPNVYIWDYTVDFNHFLQPFPNVGTIASNLRAFDQNNVKGVFLQGFYSTWSIERSSMRSWVYSKLLWNPSLDANKLMDDFIEGYYGNAAPKIKEYNDLLKRNAQLQTKASVEKVLGPDFNSRALAFMEAAEKLADNELIRNRVEIAKIPVLYKIAFDGKVARGKEGKSMALISEFDRLTVKHKQTKLSERTTGTKDFILKSKIKVNSPSQANNQPKSKSGNSNQWIAEELDLRLDNSVKHKSILPVIIEDKLAENGYAVKIIGGHTRWSVHWEFHKLEGLQIGKKYQVRARMRVDKSTNEGSAFGIGVYSLIKKKNLFKKYTPTKSVSHTQYRWFTIGTFVKDENCRIFIHPTKSIKAVYIDKMELTCLDN